MRMTNEKRLLWAWTGCAAGLLLAAAGSAMAAAVPASLCTDNMVLQRGRPVPVWGMAEAGEKVTVEFAGQVKTTVAAADGKWSIRLAALPASAEARSLTVRGAAGEPKAFTNVVVGEVWIASGQSNMEWNLARAANGEAAVKDSADPLLRLFTVKKNTSDIPQAAVVGSWAACSPENAGGFSAVGYFFGRDLRRALQVPVGVINTSWGGTPAESWTPRETLADDPELAKILQAQEEKVRTFDPVKTKAAHEKQLANYAVALAKHKKAGGTAPVKPRQPQDPTVGPHRPACLYNAMIAPLQPYAICGTIWYQGEANNRRAAEYAKLFPAMIGAWRKTWDQGEFPFLFVQIAPYHYMTPELREAQLKSWQSTPNTAMAVITDVGNATNIHPTQKEPVGGRLALAARALAYGEKMEYSGPLFKELKITGNRAILSFTHVGGGLVAEGGALKGFTISGADQKFVAADAVIMGDTVVVTGKDLADPTAVRYGWANVPDVNLCNRAGLPATPFRTGP